MPDQRTGSATGIFDGISAMSVDRSGAMTLVLADGRVVTEETRIELFDAASMVERFTHIPLISLIVLRTVRGDEVLLDLPTPSAPAPISGRPVVYLDQNHWSTLSNALFEPRRVRDPAELRAALRLVDGARQRELILPMSLAHMVETTKQVDLEQRYRRALTIVELSRGWQLRDPHEMRLFELKQAMSIRYRHLCHLPPAVVTLEPSAAHGVGQDSSGRADEHLPEELRWITEVVSAAGSNLDVMLSTDHVPVASTPLWAGQFERFSRFLAENPTAPEMKRKRTHVKFIQDLGDELLLGAIGAEVTKEQMGDWTLEHSEEDLRTMPSLGLYREIMHEKLCDPALRWEENDLIDMNYLSAGGGYCDHVVGERRHAAFLEAAVRRLDRTVKVHRNLRSLVQALDSGAQ